MTRKNDKSTPAFKKNGEKIGHRRSISFSYRNVLIEHKFSIRKRRRERWREKRKHENERKDVSWNRSIRSIEVWKASVMLVGCKFPKRESDAHSTHINKINKPHSVKIVSGRFQFSKESNLWNEKHGAHTERRKRYRLIGPLIYAYIFMMQRHHIRFFLDLEL